MSWPGVAEMPSAAPAGSNLATVPSEAGSQGRRLNWVSADYGPYGEFRVPKGPGGRRRKQPISVGQPSRGEPGPDETERSSWKSTLAEDLWNCGVLPMTDGIHSVVRISIIIPHCAAGLLTAFY
jgi:hypothetical protein